MNGPTNSPDPILKVHGAKYEAAIAEYSRLSGNSERQLRQDGDVQPYGSSRDSTYGARHNMQQLFDVLSIQPQGELLLLNSQDGSILSFANPTVFFTKVDAMMLSFTDCLIKDSTGSWLVYISHHGGVTVKDIATA